MHIFFCVKKIVIFQFIYVGASAFHLLCIFPKFIFVMKLMHIILYILK